MFDLKLTGMDELRGNLKKIQNQIEELSQERTVSFLELFPDDFMRRHTSYKSLEKMFNSSGFEMETPEDFKNLPKKEWGEFIRTHSRFNGWEEMLETAATEWFSKQLKF